MNLFHMRCITAAIYLHIAGTAANYWLEQHPMSPPARPKPGRVYWYNYAKVKV